MAGRMARHDAKKKGGGRRWVAKVRTVSTNPPKGLFTKSAATIARVLASPKVSPKGPSSGMRMLTYFINRAGKGLSAARRAELQKAKKLLSQQIQKQKSKRARTPTRRVQIRIHQAETRERRRTAQARTTRIRTIPTTPIRTARTQVERIRMERRIPMGRQIRIARHHPRAHHRLPQAHRLHNSESWRRLWGSDLRSFGLVGWHWGAV
jgi:hypothetical protein